jgi:hypothetical protein
VFYAGSADRLFLQLQIPYTTQIWIYRAAVFVLPIIAFFVTKRVCDELRTNELHPLRGPRGRIVQRGPSGGFEPVNRR